MTSITITADENLMAALQSIAEKKATTLETVAREDTIEFPPKSGEPLCLRFFS